MNRIIRQIWIAWLCVLCTALPVWGQSTRVMGKVLDAGTGEPIPFANIYFKGTTIGVTSNFDGDFSIETGRASDTLVASFIGYHKSELPIRQNRFNQVTFSLERESMELSEVVIRPGENPAEILLRKIIENKSLNNRDEYAHYRYEAYTKIEFDANNITDRFMERKIFEPFRFIFDYVDTSAINAKAYLPVFLSETLSDIYYRRSPKSTKEVIRASKVTGIRNQSISQFLGDIAQNINVYDNYLTIFQKNFVSPVANFGLGFYRYYLVDSTWVNDRWSYEIMFKPRRKQELTFTGSFWVDKETHAIARVDMRVVPDANINFISDLIIKQEYGVFDGSYWMLTRESMVADFNIAGKNQTTMGFFGKKTSSYRQFVFNDDRDAGVHAAPVNVVVEDEALDRDLAYWDQNRHDTLSRDEQAIYRMIDTLESLPIFMTYVEVIKMISTGYYVRGLFEWGPYMSLVSYNELEGIRLRLGGRTSNDFSTRLMLEGHLAYGMQDELLKRNIGFLYMVDKNPRRSLSGAYSYDIEQIGQSQNAFREDFLLAAILRRRPFDKLSLVEQYNLRYEHEWFNGLSNSIHFSRREIFAVGSTRFRIHQPEGIVERSSIKTSEIGLGIRMAYKEKFVLGEFERISLGAKYPILEINYALGISDLIQGEFQYHRVQANLRHWFNIGALGWSKYNFEAGRIFGSLPYPLLKIHEGNESYSFDEYAFNMMNYYEFISDQYLSAYYTHHFQGLFFNRIPLLRKLKWREVVHARALVGRMDSRSQVYAELPKGSYVLQKPYFEAGAGVENIFKVFRIDFVWRLSYLSHRGISPFGIRAALQFDF
ncbi:MAG TPA: DUF5686 family protein [Bacteroidales bacterium]|nr:DUF5686 family protein [Bacteroidales bacterium]